MPARRKARFPLSSSTQLPDQAISAKLRNPEIGRRATSLINQEVTLKVILQALHVVGRRRHKTAELKENLDGIPNAPDCGKGERKKAREGYLALRLSGLPVAQFQIRHGLFSQGRAKFSLLLFGAKHETLPIHELETQYVNLLQMWKRGRWRFHLLFSNFFLFPAFLSLPQRVGWVHFPFRCSPLSFHLQTNALEI